MDWMDPKVQADPQAHLDKMAPQAPSDPKDHEERLYVLMRVFEVCDSTVMADVGIVQGLRGADGAKGEQGAPGIRVNLNVMCCMQLPFTFVEL